MSVGTAVASSLLAFRVLPRPCTPDHYNSTTPAPPVFPRRPQSLGTVPQRINISGDEGAKPIRGVERTSRRGPRQGTMKMAVSILLAWQTETLVAKRASGEDRRMRLEKRKEKKRKQGRVGHTGFRTFFSGDTQLEEGGGRRA